ncbi:KH domain-containing protein [Candidatus Saccharibacteria bacterium]|nr:KH domain-containing protein [Candidatus Saccharibacteria bacterium]
MVPELDREFVEYVVKALVAHPEDVSVKRSVDEMGVLLELSVNPEDMGKVIGKAGATAKSIRTLLRVLGSRSDERVNLKIIEPDTASDTPAAIAESPTEATKESELVTRAKQEFADLDDLDL